LMDRIEGIEVKPQLVVPVKFVMRETTAPPPVKCPVTTT